MSQLDNLLQQVDLLREELISLEQALVRIPSVNTGVMPTGNETPVCEYIKVWLANHGIESNILESVPNRGNIVANIDGKSGRKGLIFMSHTDVVPVEDELKWKYPPFSATIQNGRIYGRGSSDCKALLTSQLMATRILKENGIELQDGLSLISGADEEHGGKYGFRWLAENHPDLFDAPFAINEGGGSPIEAAGALTYVLGVGEKGRLQIEIDIEGKSSHASVPWQGQNAMYQLSKVIQRIESYTPERDISTSIFEHLSNFAIEHKPSIENVDEIIQEQEECNPRFASLLKALSRMTITPTIINGGIKSNSVPEKIRLTCDVRTLPNQDEAYVRRELDNLLEGLPNVKYDVDYMAVPNSSPYETVLKDKLLDATKKGIDREDLQLIPAISTGFTDSRFTRTLGITTYGFAGTHPDDDPLLSKVHGTDESIGIKSLISGTKVMLHVAYEMLAINEEN